MITTILSTDDCLTLCYTLPSLVWVVFELPFISESFRSFHIRNTSMQSRKGVFESGKGTHTYLNEIFATLQTLKQLLLMFKT